MGPVAAPGCRRSRIRLRPQQLKRSACRKRSLELTAVVAWVRLAVRDHSCAFAREIFEVFLELLLDW